MTYLLALRLLRGGGRIGLARLALMITGFAVGVLVVTTALALPAVLGDRADRSSARLPNSAVDQKNALFGFTYVEDSWQRERFTRLFLAKLDDDAPAPPGVSRFPKPGDVFVSPRAQQLLLDHPELAARVPGRVVGTIQSEGLLGPDELYAYVGTSEAELDGGSAASSFGNATPDASVAEQLGGVSYELMLLVFVPAFIFLVVCGRLAARTRAQRYAALRLLGVRQKRIVGIAATEAAVAGGAGAIVGVLSFNALNGTLAGSQALGFSWYAHESRLHFPTAAVLVLLTALGAAFLGALGLRQSIKKPLQARGFQAVRVRAWALLPLVLGLGLMMPPLMFARSSDGSRQSLSDLSAYTVIAGIAACVIGTILALRFVVPLVGRWLGRGELPLSLRIAGARLAVDPASLLRLATGPIFLVLIAGISAGVLRDAALAAGPTVTARTIVIDTHTIADAQRRQMIASTPATQSWRMQQSVAEDLPDLTTAAQRVQGIGLTMVMANCAQVRMLTRQALPDCRDGKDYRFNDPSLRGTISEVPAGVPVKFRNEAGKEVSYTTPPDYLPVLNPDVTALGEGGVISTSPEPKFGWSRDLAITFVIPPSDADLERFKSAVQKVAPTADMHVKQLNLNALEAYRVHHGTVTFGILVGLGLCLLAFAVAAIDRMVERRREVVSLAVLGVKRPTIRVIQIVQLSVPLVGGMLLAALIGYLGGNAWLKINGRQFGWYNGTLTAMYPAIALSVLISLAVGVLVIGHRIRAGDIRRE